MRYFLYLSYNGTNYHGWQVQPNGVSVQEVLKRTLETILRKPTELTAAGRTDTGVHARLMVAHFDTELAVDDKQHFVSRMNSILPNDIAAHKLIQVKADAHARFDAISRRYEYHVVTHKHVFKQNLAVRLNEHLDFNKMNEAAATLKDYTDFSSFSKLHTDVKTNNCVIYDACWEQQGDSWVFRIEANRFLRNMVRAIVGTLLEVGRQKIDIEAFRSIIEAKNRCKAGASVPACGLYLVDIKYPDEVFV